MPATRRRPAAAPPRARRDDGPARDRLVRAAGVPWSASAGLGAAFTIAYLLLAPHVSGDKDASEFTLALSTGGVIHPTGYPLYLLAGHAFMVTLHAFGVGMPYAANAWAACGGGVALLLLHRLALRLTPDLPEARARFALAALPVVLLGGNPVWLVECTTVEVHSWQMAWMAGTALAATTLVAALSRRGEPLPGLAWRMALWGALCGVGGAHHATSVFVAGGATLALVVALARAGRWRAWIAPLWLAAGVVPLLSYATIAYRAAHPDGREVWPSLEPGLAGLWTHARARAYTVYLGHWAPDPGQLDWLRRYVAPFLAGGLVLHAWSWLRAHDAGRRIMIAGLVAAGTAQCAFALRYGVSDPDAYFLPPLAIALLSLPAVGAALLRGPLRAAGARAAAGVVAGALVLAFAIPSALKQVERAQALVAADAYLHHAWERIPVDRGILLWPVDAFYRLEEYQRYRGEKPGLEVIDTANLFNTAPRARFRRRYGFDPLALLDDAHRAMPLDSEFVIGGQDSPEMTHAFALVHECILRNSPVPVVTFDPPRSLRVYAPRAAAAPAGR